MTDVCSQFTSDPASSYLYFSEADLSDHFFSKAKKHVCAENGRLSGPTTHGLMIMFLVSCFKGIHRAGLLYRYSACEVFKRLRLEKNLGQFAGPNQPMQGALRVV